MSPRALDHLVLPCADLDAAARIFDELGFLVGRRNRHPWRTENRIIQFPGAFIELIALAPDFVPLADNDDAFPFAGFLAGQGRSAHPSAMIVLRSHDATADAAAFASEGIGTGRMLHFARDGAAPDGTTRTVAFDLAFADDAAMPDLGFFVCQHQHPENFWNPALQRHPNGTTGVGTIVLTAEPPDQLLGFLCRFSGAVTVGHSTTLGDSTTLLIRPGPGHPRLTAVEFTGPGKFQETPFGEISLRMGR